MDPLNRSSASDGLLWVCQIAMPDQPGLPGLQDRARAKQARQSFLDTSKVQEAGRFQHAIPESLRPKMGRLSAPQQRVYEDFARIPRNPMAAAKQVDQVHTFRPIEVTAVGPGTKIQSWV